jgi:hypothetical protein
MLNMSSQTDVGSYYGSSGYGDRNTAGKRD